MLELKRMTKPEMLVNCQIKKSNIFCEEFVFIMGVMLTANLILCEEKTPTSGLILPLLDKLLKHYERKEGNSVFIISLKNAVRQNRELRYRDPDLLMLLEESRAMDPRTKNKPRV